MTLTAGPTTSELMGAAERVLASWTATAATSTTGPDLGPVVLATLVTDRVLALDAVRAWLRLGARCGPGLGLFGGLGGMVAGLRMIADLHTDVAPVAERTAASIAAATPRWRRRDVGFADYDLIGGPAGVVLANLVGRQPVRVPVVAEEHLVALAAPGLTGFLIGAHQGHPLVGWTQGGVVTGLAHGVAGPLAALSLATAHGARSPETVRAIRHLSSWLLAERATDARGIVSWPRRGPAAGRVGVVRRQGWCYGSPGVSWALWTAGRAMLHNGLDEGVPVCDEAVAAMRSLCEGYDPDVHLDHDPLAICHGAAGVLLIADAFATHAGLVRAAALRDDLADHLRARLDEVARLDATLLSGASGVLAALLTVAGGDRSWLRCLALY